MPTMEGVKYKIKKKAMGPQRIWSCTQVMKFRLGTFSMGRRLQTKPNQPRYSRNVCKTCLDIHKKVIGIWYIFHITFISPYSASPNALLSMGCSWIRTSVERVFVNRAVIKVKWKKQFHLKIRGLIWKALFLS